MRIAICYFGVLRKQSYMFNEVEYIKTLHKDINNISCDYFISAGCFNNVFNEVSDIFTYSNIESDHSLNEKVLITPGQSRIGKACYHINNVIRLKEKYEIENKFAYDAVILLRTDMLYDPEQLIKWSEVVMKVSAENPTRPVCFFRDAEYIKSYQKHKQFSIDQENIFIHNNEGANLHANLYNSVFLQKNYEKVKYNFDKATASGHTIHGFLMTQYPFFMVNGKWDKETEYYRNKNYSENEYNNNWKAQYERNG